MTPVRGGRTSSPDVLRIVVVDDDQEVLAIVRELFEQLGVAVYTIGTVIGLSGLLYRVQPNVVVVDVNMPALNGDYAAGLAASVCPSAKVVIFSSDEEQAARLAAKHGATWVSKGSRDRLVAAVMRSSGRRISCIPTGG